jgi:hypothetical protein
VRLTPLLASIGLSFAALAAAPGATPDETGTASARPGGPRLVVDREVHDFGVVRQEQELETEFALKNAGDAPLRLLDVRADCGCAIPAVDAREVAPGASVAMRVLFRTLTFAGPLTKRVRIRSDDPERPLTEVRLVMDVSAGVVLSPARLAFGDVLHGTLPKATLTARWKEGVGTPFRVKSVESRLDLAFETTPYDAPPWKGTRITATFRTPPPIGTVSGVAHVTTDSPEAPRLAVPVTAFVSGKVWTSLRMVRLGIVAQGRDRAVPVSVRGFSAEVDLGEVKATTRHGRVEAQAVRTAGRPREWTVFVRVPADAKPGTLDDLLEIRTSVPDEPVTEIPVTGEVAPRAK